MRLINRDSTRLPIPDTILTASPACIGTSSGQTLSSDASGQAEPALQLKQSGGALSSFDKFYEKFNHAFGCDL
jgi:hypothetical protein